MTEEMKNLEFEIEEIESSEAPSTEAAWGIAGVATILAVKILTC